MTCECCKKDEYGNWITEPCCNNGACQSDATNKTDIIANCIHCGSEMFKENGFWYHHSQQDIPISQRGITHYGN